MLERELNELIRQPLKIRNLARENGAVMLSEEGRPAFVLMTVDKFRSLTGRFSETERTFSEMVAMEDGPNIDFEPERVLIRCRVPELED